MKIISTQITSTKIISVAAAKSIIGLGLLCYSFMGMAMDDQADRAEDQAPAPAPAPAIAPLTLNAFAEKLQDYKKRIRDIEDELVHLPMPIITAKLENIKKNIEQNQGIIDVFRSVERGENLEEGEREKEQFRRRLAKYEAETFPVMEEHLYNLFFVDLQGAVQAAAQEQEEKEQEVQNTD